MKKLLLCTTMILSSNTFSAIKSHEKAINKLSKESSVISKPKEESNPFSMSVASGITANKKRTKDKFNNNKLSANISVEAAYNFLDKHTVSLSSSSATSGKKDTNKQKFKKSSFTSSYVYVYKIKEEKSDGYDLSSSLGAGISLGHNKNNPSEKKWSQSLTASISHKQKLKKNISLSNSISLKKENTSKSNNIKLNKNNTFTISLSQTKSFFNKKLSFTLLEELVSKTKDSDVQMVLSTTLEHEVVKNWSVSLTAHLLRVVHSAGRLEALNKISFKHCSYSVLKFYFSYLFHFFRILILALLAMPRFFYILTLINLSLS